LHSFYLPLVEVGLPAEIIRHPVLGPGDDGVGLNVNTLVGLPVEMGGRMKAFKGLSTVVGRSIFMR
jgi:hypothetical protein